MAYGHGDAGRSNARSGSESPISRSSSVFCRGSMSRTLRRLKQLNKASKRTHPMPRERHCWQIVHIAFCGSTIVCYLQSLQKHASTLASFCKLSKIYCLKAAPLILLADSIHCASYTSCGSSKRVSISLGLASQVRRLFNVRLHAHAHPLSSGSKHSNFHILLKAYVLTSVPAVRSAIAALLRHILAPGVLFPHDPDEIALWLDALPHTFRASGAKAPDGAPLTDEGDGVIAFLDDCVQRCVKTPYKYVEELQAIYIPHASASTSSIGERPEAFPSPLITTVVEQLGAKLRGTLLTPSDALALFSFVRKLVLRMAGKSVDLGLPKAFTEKIRALVEDQTLFPDSPIMEGAIRREVQLLSSSMGVLQEASTTPIDASTPGVREFLLQVEKMPERMWSPHVYRYLCS